MNYLFYVILGYSIFIASIIGLVRYKNMDQAYYPFVYCVWLALLNEIISVIVAYSGKSTTFNNNVYVLAEAL